MGDINYLDPMFYLPEGMDPRDWDYAPNNGETDGDDILVDGDGDDLVAVGSDVEIVDERDVGPEDAGPPAPDTLTIVGQSLRRAPDGSIVVDVVVDVEDIAGINKYEFRVTKI